MGGCEGGREGGNVGGDQQFEGCATYIKSQCSDWPPQSLLARQKHMDPCCFAWWMSHALPAKLALAHLSGWVNAVYGGR